MSMTQGSSPRREDEDIPSRGQWEVIPGWGVRNVFHGAAIELRAVNMSPEETRAFIVRVQRLLNADSKRGREDA